MIPVSDKTLKTSCFVPAMQSNASSAEGSFHSRELDAAFSGSTFPQDIRDVMRQLHFSREEVRT